MKRGSFKNYSINYELNYFMAFKILGAIIAATRAFAMSGIIKGIIPTVKTFDMSIGLPMTTFKWGTPPVSSRKSRP